MSEAPITHYVTHTTAILVEERFKRIWVSGVGSAAKFETQSLGWFLWLTGSHEAIHLGYEKPAFQTGDRVKITFEKVPDALPVQAPV